MKRSWIILIAVVAAVIIILTGNRLGGKPDAPAATGMMAPLPGGSQSMQPDESAPKKGRAAPAFTLSSLDGTKSYQVGGKRDKAMIVNFWASWCGPCDMEAPDLVSLYAKYKDKLDLYAVNATNNDRVRNAKDFVKEKKFVFPVLADSEGAAGDAYQVYNYPTSFIIDRNGQIVERIEGVITLEQWQKYLDEVTAF